MAFMGLGASDRRIQRAKIDGSAIKPEVQGRKSERKKEKQGKQRMRCHGDQQLMKITRWRETQVSRESGDEEWALCSLFSGL
jgi:hypothetical protein